MIKVIFVLSMGLLLWLPGRAAAQTLQLPTFRQFSTNSSVLVPDRGRTYLGGVNRASSSRTSRGVPVLGRMPVAGRPFQNSGIGSSRSGGGMQVNAFIHDFEAMDRALLEQGGAAPPAGIAARDVGPGSRAVADLQAENARRAMSAEEEAADFFRRGQQAEAAGKPGVAKIFYQMAASAAGSDGSLKAKAMAQAKAVSPKY